LYDIGIVLIHSDELPLIRNGADVLIRSLLKSFGILGIYSTGIVLFIGFILVLFIQRKSIFGTPFKIDFLPFMVVESLVWGLILYYSMGIIRPILFATPESKIWFGQIIMSIGAGIYEEIIFRLILIKLIHKVIKFVFDWNEISCILLSLILSSGLFSYFHFLGMQGDPIEFPLFFIRFFGGCFLGCLFLLRGFGITAYSHCIYDLIVVVNLTT
jgi:membrane protease YdiL (CAAX protease family)